MKCNKCGSLLLTKYEGAEVVYEQRKDENGWDEVAQNPTGEYNIICDDCGETVEEGI